MIVHFFSTSNIRDNYSQGFLSWVLFPPITFGGPLSKPLKARSAYLNKREPSLRNKINALPPEIIGEILGSGGLRQQLVTDIFKNANRRPSPGSNQKKTLEKEINMLTRDSLVENLKIFSRSYQQWKPLLFEAILLRVIQANKSTPILVDLIEKDALANRPNAFEKLIIAINKTKTPIPEVTYQWVADCGQPEKLEILLNKTENTLSNAEKERILKIANDQKTIRTNLNQNSLESRQLQMLKLLNEPLPSFPPETQAKRTVLALIQTNQFDINYKKNPDKRNRFQFTFLNKAATRGKTALVEALLRADGIDVNKSDLHGDTPLNNTISWLGLDVIMPLLRAEKVDVNKPNRRGNTPLHKSINRDDPLFVSALLQVEGIDVNKVDKQEVIP